MTFIKSGMFLASVGGYLLLRVDPGASAALNDSWQVALASTIPSIGLTLMSIIAALIFLATSRQQAMRSTWREAGAALFAGSAALAVVPLFIWPVIRGDAASSLAAQWSSRRPDLGRQWMMEAIASMPGERFYTRQLILDLLANAVAELQRSRVGTDPDMLAAKNLAISNLGTAEYWAREDFRKYPQDPWVVIRLANVLQVRALRMLRPFNPAAGERAATEAEDLFAQAYRIYPSQPLLLRNWAQLRFENGHVTDAYRLLDLMESLIPAELDAYMERIAMARAVGDTNTIGATLERARPHLDATGWKTLQAEGVAKSQQL